MDGSFFCHGRTRLHMVRHGHSVRVRLWLALRWAPSAFDCIEGTAVAPSVCWCHHLYYTLKRGL
jgi:hypothetical protein